MLQTTWLSALCARCLKDKFWFGRVGLKTCLANVRGCLKTVRTWDFAKIIPFLLYSSNASVFVVILLKILMVVLTNGGAGWCRAARKMVFSWKCSKFCVLSSRLPSCLRSSSVWLAGCCLWLLVDVLAVGNQVCPGWSIGNKGGFRLIVPRKGSDGRVWSFFVFLEQALHFTTKYAWIILAEVVRSENADLSVRLRSLI